MVYYILDSPGLRDYPRGADLRRLLLERCRRYCELAGIGRSVLSEKLVNSPKYLGALAAGATKLTDVAYDRCMTRLDALFDAAARRGAKGEPTEDKIHDQRFSGGSSAVPAKDRRDRRRAGRRKRRLHGHVPDAAE